MLLCCFVFLSFLPLGYILYGFYLFAKIFLNLSLPSPIHSAGLDPNYCMCALHLLGAVSFFTLLHLIMVLSSCWSVFFFLFAFKLTTGELFLAWGLCCPACTPPHHILPLTSQGCSCHTSPSSPWPSSCRFREMRAEQPALTLRRGKSPGKLIVCHCSAGVGWGCCCGVIEPVLKHLNPPGRSGLDLCCELETSLYPTGIPWRPFPLHFKHNLKIECWSLPGFALPLALSVTASEVFPATGFIFAWCCFGLIFFFLICMFL